MEWLSDWIRHVIAVVFLATVADWVMPEGDLRRYGRVVLGLVVLLVIIEPATALLAGGPPPFNPAEWLPSDRPDPQVLERGRRLWELNRSLTADGVRRALGAEIERSIAALEGVQAARARADIYAPDSRRFGHIRHLDLAVVLGDGRPADGGEQPAADDDSVSPGDRVTPVQPVEPVEPSVPGGSAQQDAAEDGSEEGSEGAAPRESVSPDDGAEPQSPPTDTVSETQVRQAVYERLRLIFGVTADRVELRFVDQLVSEIRESGGSGDSRAGDGEAR